MIEPSQLPAAVSAGVKRREALVAPLQLQGRRYNSQGGVSDRRAPRRGWGGARSLLSHVPNVHPAHTGLTSEGRAKVQDCWKGHDPELRTWILKSTVRHTNNTGA